MTDGELLDWLERNRANLMHSGNCQWFIQHPIFPAQDGEYHDTPRAAVEAACLRLEQRAKERTSHE